MTHFLNLTVDASGIRGRFTCDAQDGAQCRLSCPEGCAQFELEGHEHALVDGGECKLVPFLNNDEAELWETYDGEHPHNVYSGPVELTYSDSRVSWRYAGASPAQRLEAVTQYIDQDIVYAQPVQPTKDLGVVARVANELVAKAVIDIRQLIAGQSAR